MEKILRVDKIKRKISDSFTIDIDDVMFEKGKIYAVNGPNGSGKSTFLNILSLIDFKSSTDKIFYLDSFIDKNNYKNIRKNITLCYEHPYIFNKSVYENLKIGLVNHNISKDSWKKEIRDILVKVGLKDEIYKNALELSTGQKQRMAIARSIIFKPDIVLLDEPFSNIDVKKMKDIENLIKFYRDNFNCTFVFSTHDRSSAYDLADKSLSIVDGHMFNNVGSNVFESDTFNSFYHTEIEKDIKKVLIYPEKIFISKIKESNFDFNIRVSLESYKVHKEFLCLIFKDENNIHFEVHIKKLDFTSDKNMYICFNKKDLIYL